jgi:hypothetical protein
MDIQGIIVRFQAGTTVRSLFTSIGNDSGSHPASYPTCVRVQGVKLATHLNFVHYRSCTTLSIIFTGEGGANSEDVDKFWL